MTARAGLLVVGHVDERAQHIAGDYPELFRALLEPVGIEIVPYAAEAGQLPGSLRECDGWLMSPSRLSVYDNEPWIADCEDVMRAAIAEEVPFVGICFGHQLLAQALGGRVEKAESGWGVGVQRYDVCEPIGPMQPPANEFALLASHQDQVVEVPSDARVIASAPYCPVAGMAVGERMWTVQAHPEFVPALAEHLLSLRVDLIGAEKVATARASLTQPLNQHLIAQWIANTFQSRRRISLR
jgi:GMP synthase-like glutamine amidotransferase